MHMYQYQSSHPPADQWAVANLSIRYRLTGTPIPIRDSEDAARVFARMWDQSLLNIQEQIGALYLNSRDQAIGFRLISSGKLSAASLDTPLLLACGLLVRAKSIVLCHNHPSGDPTPSRADIRMTQQLAKTTALIGIELYDHIVLAQEGWHSMADSRNFLPGRLLRP